jgi:hypothetical protein
MGRNFLVKSRVSFWGDENILELDRADAHCECTQRGWLAPFGCFIFCCVNLTSTKTSPILQEGMLPGHTVCSSLRGKASGVVLSGQWDPVALPELVEPGKSTVSKLGFSCTASKVSLERMNPLCVKHVWSCSYTLCSSQCSSSLKASRPGIPEPSFQNRRTLSLSFSFLLISHII